MSEIHAAKAYAEMLERLQAVYDDSSWAISVEELEAWAKIGAKVPGETGR